MKKEERSLGTGSRNAQSRHEASELCSCRHACQTPHAADRTRHTNGGRPTSAAAPVREGSEMWLSVSVVDGPHHEAASPCHPMRGRISTRMSICTPFP